MLHEIRVPLFSGPDSRYLNFLSMVLHYDFCGFRDLGDKTIVY